MVTPFTNLTSLSHLPAEQKPTYTMADNDDLLDYEEEEQTETAVAEVTEPAKKDVKGTYVSIHSSGFRDFLLKPEILRAIVDCGFEHPSEGMQYLSNLALLLHI